MFFRLLFATIAFLVFSANAAEPKRNLTAAATGEKRVALVIGNGKYPGIPLKNPTNDARDMAAALRKIGFDVIEKTNVTQKEMNRAITQFGGKLTSDTVALFFYAGHGMQVKGKNYLIPIDAQIENESSVRAETVDVDTVLDQLSASPLNVVILDACRNNPFERRFRGTGGGLAQMDAPKGTLIAYATSPGKVASDGDGRNGLYTQELLKVIQTPGLEVEKAFKRVRANVARATADNQIPWEASSLTGEFSFSRGESATAGGTSSNPAAAPTRLQSAAELEQELWDSVKNSTDAEAFQTYLDQYPKGRFVVIAKVKLKELTKPAQVATGISSEDISDVEIKLEYERIKTSLGGKEYKARHILVATEAQAWDIVGRLKKGERFEELAKVSMDPGSKDRGGDLGWANKSVWVAEFSNAMVALEKGQYTEAPVKSAFGWHVIRLDDTRELAVPPLDNVKSQIAQRLRQQAAEKNAQQGK